LTLPELEAAHLDSSPTGSILEPTNAILASKAVRLTDTHFQNKTPFFLAAGLYRLATPPMSHCRSISIHGIPLQEGSGAA